MTANQSRLLGIAILLGAVSLVLHLSQNNAADSGVPAAQPEAAAGQTVDPGYERAKARLAHGPYIASTKHISDNEEIEIVVIPEGYASELDTRCIIYKNSSLGTSAITCAGATFAATGSPRP